MTARSKVYYVGLDGARLLQKRKDERRKKGKPQKHRIPEHTHSWRLDRLRLECLFCDLTIPCSGWKHEEFAAFGALT